MAMQFRLNLPPRVDGLVMQQSVDDSGSGTPFAVTLGSSRSNILSVGAKKSVGQQQKWAANLPSQSASSFATNGRTSKRISPTRAVAIGCEDEGPFTVQEVSVLRGPDVHLIIVQICRAGLLGMGLVALLSCLAAPVDSSTSLPGATDEEIGALENRRSDQVRNKLQCALAAGACTVSSLYYYHMHCVRSKPHYRGYTREGNAVVDAKRYASWAVVIGLLAWLSFLLRGPFVDDTFMNMTYEQWMTAGPAFASLGVLLGIPGWHAARSLGGDISVPGPVWVILAMILLGGSATLSLIVGVAMHWPVVRANDGSDRDQREVDAGRWIASVWFIYPAVSLFRTLFIVFAACSNGSNRLGCLRVAESTRVRWASVRESVKFAAQKTFSTIVMGPATVQEFDMMQRLLGGGEDQETAWVGAHEAPVAPWLSQLFDSAIAIVDVMSQAYAAFICSRIALDP